MSVAEKKILFIEDDENLRSVFTYILEQEGFEVLGAKTGEEALEIASRESLSLILLDLTLPDMDGMTVAERLRGTELGQNVPIIVLTGDQEAERIIAAISEFATHYLLKPIKPKVILSYIYSTLKLQPPVPQQNSLRRRAAEDNMTFEIRFDKETWEAFLNDSPLNLTKTEFIILQLMVDNSGQVLSRSNILEHLGHGEISERSIDFQIYKLRQKLNRFGDLIETIRGVGFRFSPKTNF